MTDKKIVVNRIQTPDGTFLQSHYRHHYVTYVDKNGLEYMVDGGMDYLKRSFHKEVPYKELSLYLDDDFEEIRKYHCRGTYGKNGDERFRWVPICDMSDDWLRNCIIYNLQLNLQFSIASTIYQMELDYRKEKGIEIKE